MIHIPNKLIPCIGCNGTKKITVERRKRDLPWYQCVLEKRKRWREDCPICYPFPRENPYWLTEKTPLPDLWFRWNKRLRKEPRQTLADWTPIYWLLEPGEHTTSKNQTASMWRRLALGEPWLELIRPDMPDTPAIWRVHKDDVPWRPRAQHVWLKQCVPMLKANGIPEAAGPNRSSGQILEPDDLPEDFASPYPNMEMLFLMSQMYSVSEPRVDFNRRVGTDDSDWRYEFLLSHRYVPETVDEKIARKVQSSLEYGQ